MAEKKVPKATFNDLPDDVVEIIVHSADPNTMGFIGYY